MEKQFNLEINDNNNLIACDSSAVYLFADIYAMLTSVARDEALREKVMKSGSSLPEDYYRGAVGLLLLAIDKKVKLVIDPVCVKELCIDGDKKHKKFNCFLFKQSLFSLIWPQDIHDCVNKVRKKIPIYTKKVGSLRRIKMYSKRTRSNEDWDLNDKQSSSEIDYMTEHGGYIISLNNLAAKFGRGHTLQEIEDVLIEQCDAEAKRINNIVPNMRKNIILNDADHLLLPKQIIMHVHRNNTDFGDSKTNLKAFNEMNEVSSVNVCSLGDIYRYSESIRSAYDEYAGRRVEIKPVEPPFTIEQVDNENLIMKRYSQNWAGIKCGDEQPISRRVDESEFVQEVEKECDGADD